jgi:hypothetical protein
MTMDDEGGGEWGVVANVSVHIFHFSFKRNDNRGQHTLIGSWKREPVSMHGQRRYRYRDESGQQQSPLRKLLR